MLGSTDVQVARLFQRRIALDTLIGGVLGTVVAGGVVMLMGWQLTTLGSDLLGGLALGTRDWVLLGALPLVFALLATLAARQAVLGALGRYLWSRGSWACSCCSGCLGLRFSWRRCRHRLSARVPMQLWC